MTPMETARERARDASHRVAALTLEQRSRRCGDLRRAVLGRMDEIVERVATETGKCRTDALVSEVFSALDFVRYLETEGPALLADRRLSVPPVLWGKRATIRYAPLGTVAVISPWNYPFYLALTPILSAFFAGNAVLFKPSEHTPLKGLLEGLLEQSGFEADWVQVLYGGPDVGEALVQSRPDKILFTGSQATGRKILAQAAPLLVPVVLELGGKDPMVVFNDAQLDRAAAGALWGGLTNLGQSCTSVERLIVQEGVYGALRDRLVAQAGRLRQKEDSDPATDLGRMTTTFQVQTIRRQLDDALAKGARLLTGEGWDRQSPFIPPLIVENVPRDALLWTEETFGPVLTLTPFTQEAEAIALANDSPFGLSASVWTASPEVATRVARALHVGNVSINNVMLTEAHPGLPFGGVKGSGFGRTKGAAGLRELCNVQSILEDKNSKKREAHWFPYTREKYRLFRELTLSYFTEGWGRWATFLPTALRLESLAQRDRP